MNLEERVDALEKEFGKQHNPVTLEERLKALEKMVERHGEMLVEDEDRYDKLEKNILEWIENGDTMIYDPLNKDIAEFKIDFDYIWFIMEGEGIFDSVTPGDYKRLHDIKKKWEARLK